MIGARILEIRKQLGWSQAKLAKELDLNVKTIKNWESETCEPSLNSIANLARVFHVTSDYLLDIDSHPVIAIGSLSKSDQKCIRAICQIYISNVLNK